MRFTCKFLFAYANTLFIICLLLRFVNRFSACFPYRHCYKVCRYSRCCLFFSSLFPLLPGEGIRKIRFRQGKKLSPKTSPLSRSLRNNFFFFLDASGFSRWSFPRRKIWDTRFVPFSGKVDAPLQNRISFSGFLLP